MEKLSQTKRQASSEKSNLYVTYPINDDLYNYSSEAEIFMRKLYYIYYAKVTSNQNTIAKIIALCEILIIK